MEKVAVIQLDAMSLRLLLVEVEGSYFRPVEEIVEDLKLGKDISQAQFINVVNVSATLKLLKMFRKLCDLNSVTKSYAIASPIYKMAKNEKSFFEEIYNNTGFNFQILSEEEEMKITYSGVINNIECPKGILLHIDWTFSAIIMYNRRNIVKYLKIDQGCLTLAEKFENEQCSNAEKNKLMTNFIKDIVEKSGFKDGIEPEINFIGSGVSFLNIGKLARKATHYPLDIENNYPIDRTVFNNVYNFVEGLDLNKTMKLKGITADRADTLASGIAIAKALIEYFDVNSLQISSASMREGIIYNYVVPSIFDKPLGEMMNYSLESLKLFYENVKPSENHLYSLTLLIFKQIKVLHKLNRFYIKPLKIATSFCESGKRVSFDRSVESSFHVILNSNISGASHREILIAAFASLCQNPDNLNLTDWIKYKDLLTEEDLDAVRKIGMIIKLASILDKARNKVVQDVNCDILGDSVILKTVVNGDASFEIHLANKIAPEFKKVFKKNLQVI